MSRIKVDAIETTSGRQVYPVVGYLKFNTSGGTISGAIGGNVSSVSDLGAGDYRANFTTAISSNYCVAGSCDNNTATSGTVVVSPYSYLTSGCSFYASTGGGRTSHIDAPRTSIQFVI